MKLHRKNRAASASSCNGGTIDASDCSRSDFDISSYAHGNYHSIGQHPKSCLAVKTQRDSLNNQARSAAPHSLHPVIKAVRFDKVEFRKYPIILSDNPSTSSGAPIGIGWRYDPTDTLESDIYSYESNQDSTGRRIKMELAIPAIERERMLLESGYSRQEIRSAVQRAQAERKLRAKSLPKQKKAGILMKGIGKAKSGFKSYGRKDSLDIQH